MQLILREDVRGLGKSGEVVTVRDGYGRNYLLPKAMAVAATPRNLRRVEHEKRLILARRATLRKEAEQIAKAVESATVNISVAVGAEDRLYGSVTAKDIEQALLAQGIHVPRKVIEMPEGKPIRALGMYSLDIKLQADVVTKLKVWVVAK